MVWFGTDDEGKKTIVRPGDRMEKRNFYECNLDCETKKLKKI